NVTIVRGDSKVTSVTRRRLARSMKNSRRIDANPKEWDCLLQQKPVPSFGSARVRQRARGHRCWRCTRLISSGVVLTLLDEVLQKLQGLGLDDGARRLGLDHHRLPSRWIPAHAFRRGVLVAPLALEQPRHVTDAGALLADITSDVVGQAIEYARHLLARQVRC